MMQILLIASNAKDVNLLKACLKQAPKNCCQLTQVKSLSPALKKIKQKKWDLIIFDFNLSKGDGLKAVKKIIDKDNIVPIIILTDQTQEDQVEAALTAGVQDYLVKGKFDSVLFYRVIKYAIERKKISLILREKELYYRTLIANLHEDIIVIDKNYNITDVNNSFLKTSHYKREEVIGQKCYTISHGQNKPCDQLGEECELKEVFRNGKPKNCLHEHVQKDGSKTWIDILLSPLLDRNGKVTHIIESARDVNDIFKMKKRLDVKTEELEKTVISLDERNKLMMSILEDVEMARDLVNEEKQKLAIVVSALVQGIILFDSQAQVIVSNKAAKQMLLAVDNKLDQSWLKKVSWFPFDRIVERCFENGQEFVEEIVVRENPLEIYLIEARPIKLQKKVVNVFLAFTDITKQRELDIAKDDLISTVSHELRTPLTLIKLVLSNALSGMTGDINLKLEQSLERANTNVDKLISLINGLLEYSRIEQKRFKLNIVESSIISIMANIKAMYDPSLTNQKRKFQLNLGVRDGKLFCDSQKVEQVIANLVDNALKFTTDNDTIKISVTDTKNEIKVCIKDNGSGIAPEYQQIIFERFKQVGREYGPGAKGLGLGLSICKEIIDGHQGKIWVESEIGKGSAFCFVLPRNPKVEDNG